MSFLTRRGEGPSFPYAGQPVHVLAGDNGQPEGFAAMEITIPAGSPGPSRTPTRDSTRPSTCSGAVCR